MKVDRRRDISIEIQRIVEAEMSKRSFLHMGHGMASKFTGIFFPKYPAHAKIGKVNRPIPRHCDHGDPPANHCGKLNGGFAASYWNESVELSIAGIGPMGVVPVR